MSDRAIRVKCQRGRLGADCWQPMSVKTWEPKHVLASLSNYAGLQPYSTLIA